jgi:mannonate dehydratase
MEKTWRWFGKKDTITLPMLRQIGVEGIVTALYDEPNGAIWSEAAILDLKHFIEEAGLRWSVVESLPVSEAIKFGGENRDQLIDNYITSLENLGKAGVKTICYNFMPVLDWIRTELEYPLGDGSTALYFNKVRFAYFDCYILKREGAMADYSAEMLEKLAELDSTITEAEKTKLVNNIVIKTQGFVSGNFKEDDEQPLELFRSLLNQYKDIDKETLRENMAYFLHRIMPTCEQYDLNMCVHPDDPPFQMLGLPRIVTSADDIEWIMNAVDNPRNGLTLCAGSLSAGAHNNLPEIALKFLSRIHFAHLRSTQVFQNGDFVEAPHLEGRGELIELVRIFETYRPHVPMRVDHGRAMLDDTKNGYNAGYPLYGRMFALAQLDGVMAAVRQLLPPAETQAPDKLPFHSMAGTMA